jgi:hypothetical protein
MATEVDFANKLVQLLQVTDPGVEAKQALADAFKVESIAKIPTAFTFPPLKHPFVPGVSTDAVAQQYEDDGMECSVDFTFKSLKQPKFNLNVVLDVKSNTTMFQVKTSLSKSLKEDENIRIDADPSDIKLMVRAKSLHDSENVFSVLDAAGSREKIALNVIISKFKAVEDVPVPSEITIEANTVPSISDATWMKIEQLIQADLADEKRTVDVISKFKMALA